MSRNVLFTLGFLVVVGLLVWSAMRGVDEVECEVCITFNEQTVCRTGRGRDKAAAIQSAQTAACAVLTRGRAENVRCGNLQPTSLSCN